MSGKVAISVLLIGIAAALHFFAAPTPVPQPPVAPPEIDLTAAFQGEHAAADAAVLASMSEEIANVIEWDGRQPEPVLVNGKSLDQLRTRTREFMLRGQSLGERHPRMREIVGEYLEKKLGTSGGSVTPEQRAAWAAAYREVARASRHAISR